MNAARVTPGGCLGVWALACASLAARCVQADGTRADYDRARNLRALTQDTVFKASVRPHWSEDGKPLLVPERPRGRGP